jgi:hypothetical protein
MPAQQSGNTDVVDNTQRMPNDSSECPKLTLTTLMADPRKFGDRTGHHRVPFPGLVGVSGAIEFLE